MSPDTSDIRTRHAGVRWLTALLVSLALLHAPAAHAQEQTPVWEQFDVEIEVNKDGSFEVSERQTVRFPSGMFSTGSRTIPSEDASYIDNWSVSDGEHDYELAKLAGQSYTFSVDETGDAYRIDWYYPPTQDETVTFTLGYTVHDGAPPTSSGNYLWWTAIDAERDFPVEAASVFVTAPRDATFTYTMGRLLKAGATIDMGADDRVDGGKSVLWEFDQGLEPDESFEINLAYSVVSRSEAIKQDAQARRQTDDKDAEPRPNLSAAVLTEDDLPPGYAPLLASQIDQYLMETGSAEVVRAGAYFEFQSVADQSMLAGFSTWLPTPSDRIALDMFLTDPETWIANAEVGSDVSVTTPLEADGLGHVGEMSVQITTPLNSDSLYAPGDGESGQLDMVIFRRGDIVAVVLSLAPDDANSEVSLPDLARVWDERLIAALELPFEPEAGAAPHAPLISLADLPDGFVAAPQDVVASLIPAADVSGRLAGSQVDVYMNSAADPAMAEPTLVLGAIAPLTAAEIGQMDAVLADPAEVVEWLETRDFVPGMIDDFTLLELEPAGDASTALRFVVTPPAGAAIGPFGMPDQPLAIDYAMFRDGDRLAVLAIVHDPDAEPAVTLAELLPVIEARLGETSAGQTRPAPPAKKMTLPSGASSPDAVVVAETIKLHSGPAFEHPTIGEVAEGDRLEVIGQRADCRWLQVIAPDGLEGWVFAWAFSVTLNGTCAAISAE